MDLSFYEHLRPKAKAATATATTSGGGGNASGPSSNGGDREREAERERHEHEQPPLDDKDDNSHETHDPAGRENHDSMALDKDAPRRKQGGMGIDNIVTGKEKEKDGSHRQSRNSLIFGVGRVQEDSHSLSSYQALIERQKQGKAININAAQRLNKGTELTTADTVLAMCPKEVDRPFENLFDACDRLYPYHAMFEEDFPPGANANGEKRDRVGPSSSSGGGAEVAYWARWDSYCSGQVQFMGRKTELLEERYTQALQRCATEKALDAFQVEHLYLKDAARKVRKLEPPQPRPKPRPQPQPQPPSATNPKTSS